MKNELAKRILSSMIIIPICFFLIIEGSFLFNSFLIICFFISCYEWFNMSKNKIYHLLGYVFLIFSFYSAYILRNNFNDDGLTLFLFVIIVCVSTDIGGYIFGKILKGPKLIKISPKKTYSGMMGGYILSILSILVFINYIDFIDNKILYPKLYIFIMLILISSISQLGDLLISFFKRKSKIEDTGSIIPGHGGILDRIDGMIFAFPFSYLMFFIFLQK